MGSNHTPLIIDSGIQAHLGNKSHFSFELSWLRQDGFFEMVAREWLSTLGGNTPIERWQAKIQHLRRFLRGWAKNLSGEYKKQKEKLLLLIYELDIKSEITPLSVAEKEANKQADECIARLRRYEEAKWA